MKLDDVIALVSSVPCRIAPVLHPGGPVSRPSRGRTDRPRVGAVSHSGTGYGIIASVRVERAEDDGEWMLRMVVRAAVNPSDINGGVINKYMSPYLGTVLGTTVAAENQQNAQQRSQMQHPTSWNRKLAVPNKPP